MKSTKDENIPKQGMELVNSAREWAQTPGFGMSGSERYKILLLAAILENQLKISGENRKES